MLHHLLREAPSDQASRFYLRSYGTTLANRAAARCCAAFFTYSSPATITDIMQEEDVQALRTAVATLEHPSFAARLAEIAGKPIELFNRALPETASKAIAAATSQALNAALRVALRTMENQPKAASSYLHKALAATSGAVGGGFGLAALPIELPISTGIMLRSIGDIARAENVCSGEINTVSFSPKMGLFIG